MFFFTSNIHISMGCAASQACRHVAAQPSSEHKRDSAMYGMANPSFDSDRGPVPNPEAFPSVVEFTKDMLRVSPTKKFLGDGGRKISNLLEKVASSECQSPSSSSKKKSISGAYSQPFPNSEETKRISAAVLIQRRIRGIEARAFAATTRITKAAERMMLKSLDPLLSPVENACNFLSDIASVSAILKYIMGSLFIILVLYFQRSMLPARDLSALDYVARVLQVFPVHRRLRRACSARVAAGDAGPLQLFITGRFRAHFRDWF